REVLPGLRVGDRALLLGDEVAVRPVRLGRLQLAAREQALVAVVKLGGEHRAAPPVEQRVVEAEDVLEALIRAAEDVYMEERPALPVEDVPLAPLHPLGQVQLLLSGGEAAQVFDLQR